MSPDGRCILLATRLRPSITATITPTPGPEVRRREAQSVWRCPQPCQERRGCTLRDQ